MFEIGECKNRSLTLLYARECGCEYLFFIFLFFMFGCGYFGVYILGIGNLIKKSINCIFIAVEFLLSSIVRFSYFLSKFILIFSPNVLII